MSDPSTNHNRPPRIRFDDQVAVVTGAGSGLGRAHALLLASRGAKVLVNDIGTRLGDDGHRIRTADDVAEEIRESGGVAVPEYSSVATQAGGRQLIEAAVAEFGRIDILVNNAGNIELRSFLKLDLRDIDRILDVHLRGAFNVTHPCYQQMVRQQYGRIVFTVSGVGFWGNGGVSAYAAAKGGVFGLLQVLKLEGARHNIKVNAIAPMASTPLTVDAGMPDYLQVSPDEVAPELCSPVVAYLASRECPYSGETWSAGSGAVSRIFVARSDGYFKHPVHQGPLTTEDVADNTDAIRNQSGFRTLESWPEEFRLLARQLRGMATAMTDGDGTK